MYILVDFDNLRMRSMIQGEPVSSFSTLIELIFKAVSNVFPSVAPGQAAEICRHRLRFYGGWYNRSLQTPLSFELQTELSDPRYSPFRCGNNLVASELAYSNIYSQFHFKNTLRFGSIEHHSDLNFKINTNFSCEHLDCPIKVIQQLIDNHGICFKGDCKRNLLDAFFSVRQKMVDTMIATDLIYAADRGEAVVLVSADDDFWPAIHYAIFEKNVKVFHLYGGSAPGCYRRPGIPQFSPV